MNNSLIVQRPRGEYRMGWLLFLWGGVSACLLIVLMLGLADAKLIAVSSPPSMERILRLSLNTVLMSSTAGLLATLFGLLSVACFRGVSEKFRGVALAIALLPIFIAPPVLAIAAIRLLGPSGWIADFWTAGQATFPVVERIRSEAPALPSAPIYSLWGGGLTLAWLLYPISILLIDRAWRLIPKDVIEAARLDSSSSLKIFKKIILPYLWPSLFISFSTITFFSMIEFGIPESLRSLPVLVSEVYVQAGVFYDLRSATLVGVILIGLGALFLLPTIYFLDRILDGDGVVQRLNYHKKPFWKNTSILIPMIPSLALVPVLFLTADGSNGRLSVWQTAIKTSHEEIGKSLLLGAITVPFCVVVGFFLGLSLYQSRWRLRSRIVLLIPFLTPSPLLALSIQQTLRFPSRYEIPILDDMFYNLAQSHGPLMFVWVLRFAPLAALFVDAILRSRISVETNDLMKLEQKNILQRLLKVYLPLSKSSLMISGILIFGLCLSEVGAAVLLMPPGITNLSVRLLTQMHYAPTGQISALSVLMIIPGMMILLFVTYVWRRWIGDDD